jgi:hypothetical protein
MLLVDVDPSGASKALQVRKFVEADLDGAALEYWVATMARRGVEGFDTSAAGAKWLSYPKAKYSLSIIDGNYSAFREMVMKAPDGEVDAVATLRAEDIPLLRRARRAAISRCNQHALSDYGSFTQILWALTWKSEQVK